MTGSSQNTSKDSLIFFRSWNRSRRNKRETVKWSMLKKSGHPISLKNLCPPVFVFSLSGWRPLQKNNDLIAPSPSRDHYRQSHQRWVWHMYYINTFQPKFRIVRRGFHGLALFVTDTLFAMFLEPLTGPYDNTKNEVFPAEYCPGL